VNIIWHVFFYFNFTSITFLNDAFTRIVEIPNFMYFRMCKYNYFKMVGFSFVFMAKLMRYELYFITEVKALAVLQYLISTYAHMHGRVQTILKPLPLTFLILQFIWLSRITQTQKLFHTYWNYFSEHKLLSTKRNQTPKMEKLFNDLSTWSFY